MVVFSCGSLSVYVTACVCTSALACLLYSVKHLGLIKTEQFQHRLSPEVHPAVNEVFQHLRGHYTDRQWGRQRLPMWALRYFSSASGAMTWWRDMQDSSVWEGQAWLCRTLRLLQHAAAATLVGFFSPSVPPVTQFQLPAPVRTVAQFITGPQSPVWPR